MLPIGLAHGVRLSRNVAAGSPVTEESVELDQDRLAVRTRNDMRARFGAP
jgi:predicted homoserine dehydrogenase-like protein